MSAGRRSWAPRIPARRQSTRSGLRARGAAGRSQLLKNGSASAVRTTVSAVRTRFRPSGHAGTSAGSGGEIPGPSQAVGGAEAKSVGADDAGAIVLRQVERRVRRARVESQARNAPVRLERVVPGRHRVRGSQPPFAKGAGFQTRTIWPARPHATTRSARRRAPTPGIGRTRRERRAGSVRSRLR